jgi:hypothetical protein
VVADICVGRTLATGAVGAIPVAASPAAAVRSGTVFCRP